MAAGGEFEFTWLQTCYRRLQDELKCECELHEEEVLMFEQEIAWLRRALEESREGASGSGR